MIGDKRPDVAREEKIADGPDFRFRESRRTAIDIGIRAGAGARIVHAPGVSIVAVDIDAEGSVAVVPAVLPPIAIGLDRVLESVRIDQGNDPNGRGVNKSADFRIEGIIFGQVFPQLKRDLDRDPFPGMVAAQKQDLGFGQLPDRGGAYFQGINMAFFQARPQVDHLGQIRIPGLEVV